MQTLFYIILIIAVWSLASAAAAPILDNVSSTIFTNIIRYDNENDGSGNYKFSFETSDGTKREETGTLINSGQPDEHIAVVGSYSYRRPDGSYENVEYTADENGYKILNVSQQPQGRPEIQIVTQALPNAVVATLLG